MKKTTILPAVRTSTATVKVTSDSAVVVSQVEVVSNFGIPSIAPAASQVVPVEIATAETTSFAPTTLIAIVAASVAEVKVVKTL